MKNLTLWVSWSFYYIFRECKQIIRKDIMLYRTMVQFLSRNLIQLSYQILVVLIWSDRIEASILLLKSLKKAFQFGFCYVARIHIRKAKKLKFKMLSKLSVGVEITLESIWFLGYLKPKIIFKLNLFDQPLVQGSSHQINEGLQEWKNLFYIFDKFFSDFEVDLKFV